MTTTIHDPVAEHESRDAILTPSTLALAATMICTMSSFYLLLSAVPVHAAMLGGDLAAGFATGSLMATTIVGEFVAPRLIARVGRRPALAVALLMVAAPCLISFSHFLPLVLIGCMVRGLGLGVLLVAACGLATLLAPPRRRAEALGLYGLASAVPAIVCVPLGPWILAKAGAVAIAGLTAGLPLAGLAGVALLPRIVQPLDDSGHNHALPALSLAAWPAVSLAIGAILVGATVTFLPLAHPEAGQGTIMVALLLQGLMAAVARWLAGRPVDRHGPQGAAIGGVALVILSALCLALSGSIAVVIGMALSGLAFGVLQSATLAQLMARATLAQVDGAGALWNGAYDAGLGIGGLVFGALATGVGYAASFAIAALGLAAIAILIFRWFETSSATAAPYFSIQTEKN